MRKTIVILACCTVVLLLGYVGFRSYELWKESHWVSLAKNFEAKGDPKSEFLCLEQALRFNPRDVDACRMMANLAEASGSPTALTLRKKIVELDPGSVPDRLALAQTALLAHDFATVAKTLAGMDEAGKKDAVYMDIAGEYALAMGNVAEAELDLSEAIRIDPSNPGYQLSLAVIQLHATNALDAAEARISLRRISINTTNTIIRFQALRELTADSLQSKAYNDALGYSAQLVGPATTLFPDKLLRLHVLRVSGNADYNSYLAGCERAAGTNATLISQMALWLTQHNMPSETIAWLKTLPRDIQQNIPAALMMAQSEMLLHNWNVLQNTIAKQNWGNLEPTRHAYLARALREQGLDEASKAEWDLALSAADNRDAQLRGLYLLTSEWNWRNETEQLLWDVFNNYPQEKSAAQELALVLYQDGNTRPLMQLFSTEVSRNPSDLTAKNNLALIAMLLRAQEVNPYSLSRDVYQQQPTNSFFACTYAFSLYSQGKNDQALKIMQQVPSQQLGNNSTAGYYGLVLKAAGDKIQSKAYLERSLKGALLPEERALFQQALTGL